jgi:flavorubredoxin
MDIPARMLEPAQITPDTFVIRQLFGEGLNPVAMHVNSMVITGAEPVIVDCGPAVTRQAWLETVFGIVDPSDVRWIFLSHDDIDHTGNLPQVLDLCPQATLVTNWFSMERMASEYLLPLHRMRWVNDGEGFHAGDREFVTVMPPTFDSPTTRGLFDTSSGVYWAADSFACPVTHEIADVDELDPDFYREAFVMTQTMLSPWLRWLDSARYRDHVERVRGLDARHIASAHSATIHGAQIDRALELCTTLPDAPPAVWPAQADLDAIVNSLGLVAA